jgi:two-component system sensor histidine kinase HydH
VLIRKRAEKNHISIKNHVSKQSNSLWVDREKVQQVLLNLYLNAIDSMKNSSGKKILSISISERSKAKNVEIHVADSGGGVREEDLIHIFDPFFTSKASGSGLGLSIVHNIVEAHGGEIEAKNLKSGGAVFILRFPKESRA